MVMIVLSIIPILDSQCFLDIFELKYLNLVLRIKWYARRDRLISTSDIGQSVDSIVEF